MNLRFLAVVLFLMPLGILVAQNNPFPLQVPPGFHIDLVSNQVRGARFLAVAPNGDVLVSLVSRGKIVAVRPGNPIDEQPSVVAENLNRPHGLVFQGSDLYIAGWNGVALLKDYPTGRQLRVLFDDLPENGDHNNRALALDAEGNIFVSVGSDCNVCTENDTRLATIMRYDKQGQNGRVYARGLRNASGLTMDGEGRLWAVVNQRDNLVPDHKDLPPEELDLIRDGGDYGWPTSYPKEHRRLPNPEFPHADTSTFLPTDFNLQAHSAPLQNTFYTASQFPSKYRGAMFVAFHGSWNRQPPTGYKVVAVLFANGKPVAVEDFVAGWLTKDGHVLGRPVGLAQGLDGSLYVSDDTGYLFRISYR